MTKLEITSGLVIPLLEAVAFLRLTLTGEIILNTKLMAQVS